MLFDVNRILVNPLPTKRLRSLFAAPVVILTLVAALLTPLPPAIAQSEADSCVTGGAVADADSNPWLVSDCEALLAARDTLAGSAKLNWSASTPMNQWEGITLADTPLRVTVLGRFYGDLNGEIPKEFGRLASLRDLNLVFNQLTGKIPKELGNLAKLQKLQLGGNHLTGEIPAELGQLTNLTELILAKNQLNGELPAELGQLDSMRELDIHDNRLTGEMPFHLTRLTKLRRFYFHNNPGLCAPIYDSFQTWLRRLFVVGSDCAPMDSMEDRAVLVSLFDKLDGTNWDKKHNWVSDEPIRSWYGVVSDADGRVTRLSLESNGLTGEIPTELGALVRLEDLALTSNQLTGEIPEELGSLTKLRNLLLWNNQLTGEIPEELGRLENLRWLSLVKNQLTGEIPGKLGQLSSLGIMDLGYNQLNGEIPPELGDLMSLQALSLTDNRLTGEIPKSLGDLSRVVSIELNRNQLTGEIPQALGNLTRLSHLDLSHNLLTGEIPEALGDLPALDRLDLGGNYLTGCVPGRLRTVFPYHFSELGLPFCDVLLSSLTLTPGSLVPPFDPYQTEYTIAVGRSRVTVLPSNDHDALIEVLDRNLDPIEDADDSLPGHQVEFSSDIPTVYIKLLSGDGQAMRTYTVTDLGIRYDINNNGALERDEALSAIRDYFNELINRDEVIGIIRLYFSFSARSS